MEPLTTTSSTLRRPGTDITDATDISVPTLPTFAAWRANVEHHEDRLLELLGEQGVEEFVESTHILEGFWQDETLGYGILAAIKAR